MAEAIEVEVVAADGVAWEGQAHSIIVRTTEGDVGIWPSHEPFLAAVVPCAVEIIRVDGVHDVVAVDGGFVSVADNRVSILAQYARIAREIDVEAARREFALAEKAMNEGRVNDEIVRDYHRAAAQVKAAERAVGVER
ncbi:MAG: F0F1 ATP synthase subunit epsilon [Propionibacteriaceae bacterium]|jgi:F-type H+-transporting ATPase subunit epsilon|nr:F0F1 ATP synthase subunit epsilon [Propionibacteriaceae bacterium]